MNKLKRHSKRVLTGVIGASVVLTGIILIPYPGPGWLIVFAGFAILSTEFEFAAKILEWLKEKYEGWVDWLKRQHLSVQVAALIFTGSVVVVTIWLFNAFGFINSIFQLRWDWLISPFFR